MMRYAIYRNGCLLATFRSRDVRDSWFWTLPLMSIEHLYTRDTVEEVKVS